MSFSVRAIKEGDLEIIMKWRMDPEITKYMYTDPVLTLEGQKEWLKKITSDESVKYWLIEVDEKPAGVINLAEIDREKRTTSWAYYVGEVSLRSLDLALALEMSLYDYVFDVLEFVEIHCEVFSFNKGVVKLHLFCGNHVTEIVKNEVEKNGVQYDVTHLSITKEEWKEFKKKTNYEHIIYEWDD